MKLFHISEHPNIEIFSPRTSPQQYEGIKGDIVFAISGSRLHNYLLPRDCPRVCYHAGQQTDKADLTNFSCVAGGNIIMLEESWRQVIEGTILYCYEFPTDTFELLDENAGYYISYTTVVPLYMTIISDLLMVLAERGVEVKFVPSLLPVAEAVQQSTLSYSLIRMSNATPII